MKKLYTPDTLELSQAWKALRPLERALEIARVRMIVVCAGLVVAFIIIAGRLFDITMLRGGGAEEGFAQDLSSNMAVFRADIVDRNGELLATSLRTSSLYANAKVLLNPEEAAKRLVGVLPELNIEEVIQKLTSKKGFVWLARHLTPTKQAEILRLGIPGLYFQRDERRVYPHGSLLAHVLGFTDIDNKGIAGIERKFNNQLMGNHSPLQLSIDLRVQHILHDELKNGVKKYQAQGGAGIIMSVKTGEILAMASLPDFDPNQVNKIGSRADALFNRITLGIFELGSSFKIFNTAMVLESGVASLSTRFDVTEPIRVGHFRITDLHPKHYPLNMSEIFMYSSNIGSVKMVKLAGSERQKSFFKKLGFFQPATLEIPEIGTPLYPKNWSEATTITAAYGYGIAISPLQLFSAVAGIINFGVMYQPTLLKKQNGHQRLIGKRLVSEQTSEIIRKLFRLVVSEGTGRQAAVKGYDVGGKSGTANTLEGRSYKQGSNMTSFIGAFPMSNPQYIILVMVDRPKGIKETYGFNAGGWNAAPITGKVISRIAPLLQVAPIKETHYEKKDTMFIPIHAQQ